MSHIHVCLVSDQPIPNITTVLQFRPDTVVLLKTNEMDEKAKLLEDVIKKKGFEVYSETIDAYDINNVINVSESLINKYRDSEISLNITGGTKIGTLGTFQSFYANGKQIFYVDTKDNKILELFPKNKQSEIPIDVSIPIVDYLALYGFRISSEVEDDSYIFRRKELTNYLARLVSIKFYIYKINSELHKYNDKSSLPISVKMPNDKQLLELLKLLDGVDSNKEINSRIIINTHDALRYLKGFWFEEYVYMVAKSLEPDEIKLNIKGKWVAKGQYSPKNEFDVMLSKRNRLFYISCKTADPDRKVGKDEEGIGKEYIYELVSLSNKALGLFGKRMLVSAKQINDPTIKERAKILNVDVVDGKNVLRLKEVLKNWLNT